MIEIWAWFFKVGIRGVQPTRQFAKTEPIQPNPSSWVNFKKLVGYGKKKLKKKFIVGQVRFES